VIFDFRWEELKRSLCLRGVILRRALRPLLAKDRRGLQGDRE
jgi:hypothetical protein